MCQVKPYNLVTVNNTSKIIFEVIVNQNYLSTDQNYLQMAQYANPQQFGAPMGDNGYMEQVLASDWLTQNDTNL